MTTTHNPFEYWRAIAEQLLALSHTNDAPSFFRNDGASLLFNPEFLNNLQTPKQIVLIVSPPNTIYKEENSGIRSHNNCIMYLMARTAINDFDEMEQKRNELNNIVKQLMARLRRDRKEYSVMTSLLINWNITNINNIADNWFGYQIQYDYYEACVPVTYDAQQWA